MIAFNTMHFVKRSCILQCVLIAFLLVCTLDRISSAPNMMQIGGLLSGDCLKIVTQVKEEAPKAFEFIKEKICKSCKIKFKPAYEEYNAYIRDKIAVGYIENFFKKNYKFIENLSMKDEYNKVTKECIEKDKKIMSITNICTASKDYFNSIKGCVLSKVSQYFNDFASWVKGACTAAVKGNLITKIVKPVFKPNWKEEVEKVTKSKLCIKA